MGYYFSPDGRFDGKGGVSINRFRFLRISAGLRQADVARALGISQVSVWQWEHGGKPRVDKLASIAKLYGCTIEDLIGGERSVPSDTATSRQAIWPERENT